MNEEKIPNEENIQEASKPEANTTNEKTENEPKDGLNERIENDEPANEIPGPKAPSPSTHVVNKPAERRYSTGIDDDEPLNEISFAHDSNAYNTHDEDMEFEDEFGIEEHWDSQLDPYQARLSIFNPMDVTATELKTEDATLKLSKLPRLAPLEEETSMERIFNQNLFMGISLDTLVTMESFEADETVENREGFFEKLGNVPEVKDIKSESLHSEEYQPRHYLHSARPVHGKFVDPLTGRSLSEAVDEDAKVEEIHEISVVEEAAEEEQEAEVSDVEFDDFDLMFPDDEEVTKQKKVEQADQLMDIFAAETEGKFEFQEIIIEEKETEVYKTAKTVEYFLDDLLNYVVCFFEQKEGDQYLRERLDKKKLFFEIEHLVKEFLVERSVQSFLNRKIENYYRRKRQLRNITPERPEVLAIEREKYKEAVENLNQALGRETYINKKTSSKIVTLFEESYEAEQMSKAERRQFNELVKKTFKRENMPKLEALIEKDLENIAIVADEISKVRAVFISRQHMLGTLRAQLDELENIGNGLRVADYENIERETIRLEKKIEEHNNDLERLFARFRNTIHTMAHSKIRNEMFINCIKQQVKHLSELDEEQNKCRHQVYQLKKQRQQIQRQISDLSFQCGLLDKPAILLDYDRTAELVEKKRAEVEILRETFRSTEEKLKRAEAACKEV